MGVNGPVHMNYHLTRAKFDELTKELVEKCGGNCVGVGVYIKIKGLCDENVDYLLEVEE